MTQWLIDTLIATSALLLLVLLIRSHVARHFGATIAYCLWLLPAARLFMPSLSREVTAPPEMASPITMPVSGLPVTTAPVSNVVDGSQSIIASSQPDWAAMAITLWLGGAAMLFIIQMLRYVALRDEMLADAIEQQPAGDIRVVATDRIGAPLAFGLFRRFIAVPADFSRLYSPQERELALAHEAAHHRAGDLYINFAAFLFLCLQWFNPLAWLSWSAFRLDQEAACDARVLAGCDPATRACYGRTLARSANDFTPQLAMALNNPRTIIERLRRLMMKNPSKARCIAGRLAILAATAIALPLTATVVPVYAEETAPKSTATKVQNRKMIIIKDGDGKAETIDVKGDEETPFVKTIEKDGRTIVLRSNKELSDADVEKMVDEAEKSRGDAEAAWGDAEAARGQAEAARGEAEAASGEAEAAKGEAEAHRAHAKAELHQKRIVRVRRSDGKTMAWTHDGDMHSGMIPDIDIHEIDAGCKNGEVVSTHVNGNDGQKKAGVKIVLCGKGQAKLARLHAIEGLKEARKEMKNDRDIPDSVRKSVLDSLQMQIDRMEKQLADDKDAG